MATNRRCLCIAWHDDRGIFNHVHYMDETLAEAQKILSRKWESTVTPRSTHVTLTETTEPCKYQSKEGHYPFKGDPLEDPAIADRQIKQAIDKAQEAFWREIAASFPQINTGDLDPLATVVFDLSCEKVVREWVRTNE